jgi:hypothetical protein
MDKNKLRKFFFSIGLALGGDSLIKRNLNKKILLSIGLTQARDSWIKTNYENSFFQLVSR